jgi:hypothetical protein
MLWFGTLAAGVYKIPLRFTPTARQGTSIGEPMFGINPARAPPNPVAAIS